MQFLKISYNVKILQSADGPDVRRWIFECEGKVFELIHDDGIGNYFIAPSEESEPLLYKIGKDLEERLKKYIKSENNRKIL